MLRSAFPLLIWLCRYGLEVIKIPGVIKEALKKLKSSHPKIKAVFMGTRKTDPKAGTFYLWFLWNLCTSEKLIHKYDFVCRIKRTVSIRKFIYKSNTLFPNQTCIYSKFKCFWSLRNMDSRTCNLFHCIGDLSNFVEIDSLVTFVTWVIMVTLVTSDFSVRAVSDFGQDNNHLQLLLEKFLDWSNLIITFPVCNWLGSLQVFADTDKSWPKYKRVHCILVSSATQQWREVASCNKLQSNASELFTYSILYIISLYWL